MTTAVLSPKLLLDIGIRDLMITVNAEGILSASRTNVAVHEELIKI